MRAVPYFATNPIAATVLTAAFVAWMCSEYRIGKNKPPSDAQRSAAATGVGIGLGLLAAYIGGCILSLAVPATVITTGGSVVFVVGLVVAAAGQALRLAAVRQLGSFFTFEIQTAPGQRVIDTGLYRLIRHPSYTGALICALGFTIAYGNWLAPLTVSVLALGCVIRIPAEERALVAGLGDPYRQYMAKTKRLIPYVL